MKNESSTKLTVKVEIPVYLCVSLPAIMEALAKLTRDPISPPILKETAGLIEKAMMEQCSTEDIHEGQREAVLRLKDGTIEALKKLADRLKKQEQEERKNG